jgi:hypothetical protein
MKRTILLSFILLLLPVTVSAADPLESGWNSPPREARLRAYWWWLNGCVTKEAITRDLEEMKAKGFGGALICDADGSAQDGNQRVPHGATFFSPEWRELYKHALREADRLGLEMSLNIQSGWNLGGPMVTVDDAAKKLVWSELRVTGPAVLEQKLPEPAARDGYYRDAMVLAYLVKAPEEKTICWPDWSRVPNKRIIHSRTSPTAIPIRSGCRRVRNRAKGRHGRSRPG